jgi:hypothetical protein
LLLAAINGLQRLKHSIMKRRSFVKSSLLLTSWHSIGSTSGATAFKKTKQEFYELRVYTLNNAAQQQIVEDYFEKAAIPALNRLGTKNIGVFKELNAEGQTKLFVLIPFNSMDDYISSNEKLLKDAAYLQAGAAYINAPATAPAYERIQSSLLRAFAHMPALVPPALKPRIFELRRYESASEAAGKKKIEMFNDAGEIEIFKRVGLQPVFFGETLIGDMRPNLTYMLTFDDMAQHDRSWKAFGSDAGWKRISSIPDYADAKIVSRITRTFLEPTAFSQV